MRDVTKVKTVHRCTECGSAFPRWSGRCGVCDEWNTLVEEEVAAPAPPGGATKFELAGVAADEHGHPAAVALAEVDATGSQPFATGLSELDRVLGGGLVPGSVTLLAGEPGIGKSTFLLQCLAGCARRGRSGLLVAGEESAEQVRRRADRLGAVVDGVRIVATTDLAAIFSSVAELQPAVVVVDSVQTITDPSIGATAGTVTQVRECAAAFVRMAKLSGTAVLLVGHVTKDGAIAGPRALEHVVDTVLTFEGERHHALRLLGAVKHRFGATGELGVLEMTEQGLVEIADPSRLLTGERRPGVAGSVVVSVLEGQRPILLELQALVASSSLPAPRRSAQGVPASRLALLIAVLERRLGRPISFGSSDVFVSIVGGVRVSEPAIDLGLGLALVSAASNVPVPADLVACGEVGLGGEIRQVGRMTQRLAEARRLGFTRAIVGHAAPDPPEGVTLLRAHTMAEAADRVFSGAGSSEAHALPTGQGLRDRYN
jgi:DNA repair protein RadA/Sms